MNIIRKLTRQQYLTFVDDYYHGRYANTSLSTAFQIAFTQLDDPILHHENDDEKILDHIERHYVVPEQLAA